MQEAIELAVPEESSTVQASSAEQLTSKKKRKKNHRSVKKHILGQFTIRNPPWAYIHLQRLTSVEAPLALDAVTAQLHLIAALTQFLGMHGAAIQFDILKLEGQDVWIRLQAEDRSALVAAVGGWVNKDGEAWRIKGWSSWDANAIDRESGQDLFGD